MLMNAQHEVNMIGHDLILEHLYLRVALREGINLMLHRLANLRQLHESVLGIADNYAQKRFPYPPL
jgi:hypothetical protein